MSSGDGVPFLTLAGLSALLAAKLYERLTARRDDFHEPGNGSQAGQVFKGACPASPGGFNLETRNCGERD